MDFNNNTDQVAPTMSTVPTTELRRNLSQTKSISRSTSRSRNTKLSLGKKCRLSSVKGQKRIRQSLSRLPLKKIRQSKMARKSRSASNSSKSRSRSRSLNRSRMCSRSSSRSYRKMTNNANENKNNSGSSVLRMIKKPKILKKKRLSLSKSLKCRSKSQLKKRK